MWSAPLCTITICKSLMAMVEFFAFDSTSGVKSALSTGTQISVEKSRHSFTTPTLTACQKCHPNESQP